VGVLVGVAVEVGVDVMVAVGVAVAVAGLGVSAGVTGTGVALSSGELVGSRAMRVATGSTEPQPATVERIITAAARRAMLR
jgi:hypothetical protein